MYRRTQSELQRPWIMMQRSGTPTAAAAAVAPPLRSELHGELTAPSADEQGAAPARRPSSAFILLFHRQRGHRLLLQHELRAENTPVRRRPQHFMQVGTSTPPPD